MQRCRPAKAVHSLCFVIAILWLSDIQVQAGRAGAGARNKKLCSGTNLKIGEKVITSFEDLSKYFAYYSLIPKIDTSEMVALNFEGSRPCGAFVSNMTLYIRAGTHDLRQFKSIFQQHLLKPVRDVFNKTTPRTILDLGAHTGMSTAYLASQFPAAQIVAVEPDLHNFALLRLNTAKFPQAHLEYGAAWDKSATVKMSRKDTKDKNLWQRFMVDLFDMTTGKVGDIVPAVQVSQLMQKHNWTSIDLVHSDMEGAERIVIADPTAKAWLKYVKCMAVRQMEQPNSAVVKMFSSMTDPKFVRKVVRGSISVWCRADAQL